MPRVPSRAGGGAKLPDCRNARSARDERRERELIERRTLKIGTYVTPVPANNDVTLKIGTYVTPDPATNDVIMTSMMTPEC